MAEEQVHVTGHAAAEPAAVWSVAGDFCAAWHPAIATIRAERDGRGALIRAFTAKGEDTLYREQLVYRSDSDRVLSYTHLEGIAGAERYDARLQVLADEGGGSRIEWSARLSASSGRAPAIAAGTKAIFEMGIAALGDLAGKVPHEVAPAACAGKAARETVFIAGDPRLALTVTPQRPGPLVLFLHGIGGARTNWLAQLDAAEPIMRAAALDLRGYGESRLGPSQSTVEDYCGDILRVAEELGARRLVLCGLSYGSWLATSFAMRHPEMLAGLVLSGGCTGMSEAGAAEREAFRTAREVPLDAGRTPADFAPAVVEVLAGPGADEAVRHRLLTSMAAIPAATYRDALRCFTHPPERFDFTRLTMPVLMMTGRHDRLAPVGEIRAVANRIAETAPRASVRFEVIEDAGHVCNVERPAAYNRVLGEFLSELAR
ncbi:alpha/beta fold hydrolase [Shinella sp. NM-101]|uniref:alpha/beta fold hydrolase n=1 Tax=Shinella sp. NM-101 TaxID=2744455 RepID=UPI001F2C9113|nr:alpha/beta fold hydrolase [Shinella sp. NM-101]